MNSLEFRVATDLEECQALWEKFSPHQTIFQEWDWRYTHYKYFNYPLKFIVGYTGNQPIGLLPLEYESAEGYWQFFGGEEMEDNGIWVKPGFENREWEFLRAVDEPVWLDYLRGDSEFIRGLAIDDVSYELDLAPYADATDFLENHLTGKLRKHTRAGQKGVRELKPEIVKNDWKDLEKLFDLNIAVFGAESSFLDEVVKKIYRDLVKLPYEWRIFSVRLGGAVKAVTLSVVYKGVYYFYVVGYDRSIKDLSPFLNLVSIDEAKKFGAQKINFGYHDCGWKERWGLARIEYHEYYANLVPAE
ncbi:MAG: GNAT family N-acetyltransferase [Candidatus Magasanikbacteria bacterium]|jgi:CelD/BcsL family acetyltransferase involved in cellulose biosynthesis